MEQGFIRPLKSKYRICVIQKLIKGIDQGKQIIQVRQISILESMTILVVTWSEVTETTIAECFSAAKFLQNFSSGEEDPFSKLEETFINFNGVVRFSFLSILILMI